VEIRRILRIVLAAILVSSSVVVISPQPVAAWDNVYAHPVVNRLAIDLFFDRVQTDPQLKGYKGATFSNISKPWGMAWDTEDGTSLTNRIPNVKRQKKISEWIIDGGFSGDEPEGPMAMRHFYDPTNKAKPYLTDMDFIAKVSDIVLHTVATNPEISAVDWASDKDTGIGERDILYKQDYSFPDAKRYFKEAVESKDPDNMGYGNAWRAVGETMHLMADMGLSPHVRNDGHGLFDKDYVETHTTATHMRTYNNTRWTQTIDYSRSVPEVMHDMAAFTNKNCFSQDTITVPGQTKYANGMPAYSSPVIGDIQDHYAHHTVDGVRVRSAAESLGTRFSLRKKPCYVIDRTVMAEQLYVLVPTIVRASESILERFLPMFQVQAGVKPDPNSSDKYVINGTIALIPTVEWKEQLKIRNGAYVSVAGIWTEVKLSNADNFNDFTFTVSGKPGDEVKVIYDLGGYVIESPAVKIPSITIDPLVLNAETNKEYTFTAKTDSPLTNASYRWSVNAGIQQTSASNVFKTKFSSKGDYTVAASLLDSKGQEIAKASSKVTVKDASTPTVPTAAGYWQYKGTWNSEIKKVDPIYTSQQWEVKTLTDGAISAVEKIRDNSVETRPWLEKTFTYNWSAKAKNGNLKDKMYPGDEVSVTMNLNYVGIDPKKLIGEARMYCGGFDKYPQDNIIRASNPGGSGSKTVTIPVTQGFKGATNFVKVHCEGGYQGLEFAYLYEWVPGTP
jgi:hypothetical protein